MLVLVFTAGRERYALPAARVREIAPVPELRPIPGAPPTVPGLLAWRGANLPVVDLSMLLTGSPAPALLSTRLVVVDYRTPDGRERLLGLLCEKAVETVRLPDAGLAPSGASFAASACLGPLGRDEAGMVQLLRVEEILPEELRAALHPLEEELPHAG
jgi:chemotaxis-related protein WspB